MKMKMKNRTHTGSFLFYIFENNYERVYVTMNHLLNRSKLFFSRNAPTILTCLAAAGTIATSVMAVKATPKALQRLDQAKKEKGEELTKLEVVQVAAPAYVPAAVVGTSTLVCIFGANALNKRKQASLISAYALLDNSYKEYKNKVAELYGEEADVQIKQEIVKDKYEAEDVDISENNQLFFDFFSNRYFESTIEKVQNAEYFVNRQLALWDCVDLNYFYDLLEIPRLDSYNNFGWSVEACFAFYGHSWVDFDHQKVTMDDGLECTIIMMPTEPIMDFDAY